MSVFKDLGTWGVAGILLCFTLSAQTPDAATQQLQQLIDSEQSARQSGDPGQVIAAAEKLTEAAGQQMTATTEALKQPHLAPAQSQQLNHREQQLREVLSNGFNDWGTAEARQKEYQQALTHFQQAEKWDAATPGVMRNLGTAAFLLQDYPESVRALTAVVTHDANDQRSRLMLAMSFFSMEKFADAAKNFSIIPDTAMHDTRSAYAWSFSLARTGQDMQANSIIDNLAARDLTPDVRMLVCQLYNTTENYEHAVPCFKKLAEENPTMPRANFEAGAALVHFDRPADAIPELRAELKLNPQDVDAQYYLAFALLETSQKDEALSLLRTVIAEKPDHAQAQYQMGKVLLEDGKVDEAIPHLETAAKLDPSSDYIHYQLQAAYRRAGRTADANRELEIYKQIKASHRNTGAPHESTRPAAPPSDQPVPPATQEPAPRPQP
ncbi:tetratricopeptide repeat protein [Alloacidobacterium sp.]|uniref:tetratricopeptide repeat protein n=1 Tax=Alloacidobacterium sp. TaxID=2951999 RepID=UPI002D338DAC|nr:tetratricopeptide repeat protein [Alloacidobacterium sp.]HYK37264.1 tetratricopeptide repeat protein [Alloacidobacterium sp.]